MARRPAIFTVSRWSRLCRSIGYLAIAASGTFILFLDIFGPYYKTMGAWCLIGGLCSFVGAVTDRWGGEYMGLPLVGSAMVTFAALTYRDTWAAAHWISVPSILLLVGYGVLLAGRWVDVAAIGRSARAHANARR